VVASSCSFECEGWLRCLREARDVPTIIVAQGMCRRVQHDDLDRFFASASEHLARGVEIVVDYDARRPLRPSSLREAACLEVPRSDGSSARYPRLRFAKSDDYPPELAHAVRGLNGISRLFHGRGMPSVAHLHLA
jgi:O-methyltransferase involved in polyketide biosynthesis